MQPKILIAALSSRAHSIKSLASARAAADSISRPTHSFRPDPRLRTHSQTQGGCGQTDAKKREATASGVLEPLAGHRRGDNKRRFARAEATCPENDGTEPTADSLLRDSPAALSTGRHRRSFFPRYRSLARDPVRRVRARRVHLVRGPPLSRLSRLKGNQRGYS